MTLSVIEIHYGRLQSACGFSILRALATSKECARLQCNAVADTTARSIPTARKNLQDPKRACPSKQSSSLCMSERAVERPSMSPTICSKFCSCGHWRAIDVLCTLEGDRRLVQILQIFLSKGACHFSHHHSMVKRREEINVVCAAIDYGYRRHIFSETQQNQPS